MRVNWDDVLRRKCDHTVLGDLDAQEGVLQQHLLLLNDHLGCFFGSLPGHMATVTYFIEIVSSLEDSAILGLIMLLSMKFAMQITACFFLHACCNSSMAVWWTKILHSLTTSVISPSLLLKLYVELKCCLLKRKSFHLQEHGEILRPLCCVIEQK